MARTILILLVLAGTLIAPEDVSSCGPFFPEVLFSGRNEPLDPARYFGGQLGVLQPQYKRIYLMAAYRYLNGSGLSAEDQKALLAPQPGYDGYDNDPAVSAWLKMRVLVGAPAVQSIERYKSDGQFSYIVNCGEDAFANAAATLGAHFQAGLNHDDLRAWVAAQDQVFANCSPPPQQPQAASRIPDPLPASAPQWMQADRAYQIAAANFYAGEFDAAAADFQHIAEDRASAWHAIAPYLVARALIRKTTLDGGPVSAAEKQLRKVLADPDAAAYHESARGLLRFLHTQTDPVGTLNEVAGLVATRKTGVAGLMNDYRLLLDRTEEHQQNRPRGEEITDWIATMQHDADDHSLERWRATRSIAWLIAALTWAGKPDPEMMAAAEGIPETSPAYRSAQFHRLRLLPPDEARPQLDAILKRKLDVSTRNLFLAERLRLARDWAELLRYAPRTEAAAWTAPLLDKPNGRPRVYFDQDAGRILDRQAPLAVLRQAAESPSLPANLQLEVARTVWVRSVILHDTATARDMAPVLASRAPYLRPFLDGYLTARDDQTREFAAAWLLLNNPGMRPWIDGGEGRLTATPKIDAFRDNWWCAPAQERPSLNAPLNLLYRGGSPDAAFVSAAQQTEAQRQFEQLRSSTAAATLMARAAVEWAGTHPDDPRVPESLHLAVRTAHLACGGDQQTDRWAKRAFTLLHDRYPRSDAARRTPYWYKAGEGLSLQPPGN